MTTTLTKDNIEAISKALETILGPDHGWVLAPQDPVPEMIGAFWRYKNGHHFHDEPPPTDTSDYGAYRAMMAESPFVKGHADD